MGKKKKDLKIEINPIKKTSFWVWLIFIFTSYFILNQYLKRAPIKIEELFLVLSPQNYFPENYKIFFIENLKNILLGLFAFFSVFSFGNILLKFLKFKRNFIEEFVFSYALGLIIVICFTLLFGIIGIINKNLYLTFSILIISLNSYFLFLRRKEFTFSFKEEIKKSPFFYFLLFFIFIINFIQTFSPETFYDTIIYHLAVPNYWRIEGKIIDLPHNIFSKMPMNHSLIYLYGLVIGNEITAKFLNFMASFSMVLGIIFLFRKYFSFKTTLWASLIFASIFHYMNVSWYASTDVFLSFFIMLSFYFLIKNYEEENILFLILSGIFAGVSMGIKYNSVIMIFSIFISFLFLKKNFKIKYLFKTFLIFSISALPFMSFWLIKNYINYHNPVYPLLLGIFNKDLNLVDLKMINNFLLEVKQFSFNFKDWLLHPFYISIGKITNSEYFTPIFICVLPLAIFSKKKNEIIKYFWIYFLLSWILWSFSSNVIRYLMPSYFAMAILTAYYINEGFEKKFERALKILAGITIFISLYWATLFFYSEEKWKVFFEKTNKDDYLSASQARYPWPSYGMIKYINENLKNNDKVLFLGEAKTLYMNKNFEASSVFDRNILIDYSNMARTSKDIYDNLKKEKINYILFNIKEAQRNDLSYNIFYFNKKGLENFNDFFKKYLKEVKFFDEMKMNRILNRVVLYKLVENNDKEKVNYISEIINNKVKK